MASSFWRGKGAKRKVEIKWKNELGIWQKEVVAAATLSEGKAEAMRREFEAEQIRAGKKRPEKPDITIREAVALHLAALRADFGSRDSLEGRYRNRFLEVPCDGDRKAGDMPCREFTAGHLKAVLACKKDCSAPKPTQPGSEKVRGLEPNAAVTWQTREHLRVAVQSLFTYLKQAKRVEGDNPAALLGKLWGRKKTPKFLKPADIPVFFAAVPIERRLHFAFNLGVGARKTESRELQWPDVHEEEGYAVLDHTKDKEGRMVPLPEWLCMLLRAHRATSTSRWVFPKPEGLKGAGGKQPKWVALDRIVKTSLRRAGLIEGFEAKCVTRGKTKGCGFREERHEKGTRACPKCRHNTLEVVGIPIPITFHNLRSTFATYAYAHTRDIHFVQLVLGHSDPRVTARYAAVVDQHMRMLANRVQLNPFGSTPLTLNPGTPAGQADGIGVLHEGPGGNGVTH